MNQAEEDALITQYCDSIHPAWHKDIRLAIRAAVAHERERAAKVCEDFGRESTKALDSKSTAMLFNAFASEFAAAIRRGDD